MSEEVNNKQPSQAELDAVHDEIQRLIGQPTQPPVPTEQAEGPTLLGHIRENLEPKLAEVIRQHPGATPEQVAERLSPDIAGYTVASVMTNVEAVLAAVVGRHSAAVQEVFQSVVEQLERNAKIAKEAK